MPRKRQIPILGPSYVDPNLHWSRQDTLNWLLVKAEQGGTLTQWQLRDAPGPKPFVRITREVSTEDGPVTLDIGAVRGMRNVEGKLFVVAGQTLYQISNTGVAIAFGTIPGVGRVSMAHNQVGLGNELIIVNGSAGYVFDTNTNVLTKITDEGYPGAFIADYIDQYLPQVEPQGRFWFHSDLANAMAYSTLDRYEAESDPDRIVSLIVSQPEIFIFGKDTTEVFVNTGEATGTFQRATNTAIRVGCSSKFTPRSIDNSFMWLDDKRLVRRMTDGYNPTRVSTDAIDSAFQECSETEIVNCYAFTWESRGHKVYYITVPGRFTFGYDVLTGSWHRRSTWNMPHWDVVDAVYWNGRWIAGSGRFGRLYELDWDYKLDSCDPLVRKRVTGKLWDDENELTLNNVELKFNTGGSESVCVPFPEQPEGPTLTGTAPDGTVNIAYSFAYTATPGDNPIARTVLMPGSTDITEFGLSWNQNTATLSGTPTEPGPITLVLRTYDTAGLYSNHTDEIAISAGVMALKNEGESGTGSSLFGDLANAAWDQDALLQNKSYLIGTLSGFVAYSSGGHPAYTLDGGVTWAEATGATQSGVGGLRVGGYSKSADTVVLPQGLSSGVTVSTDGGLSFTAFGSYTASMTACIDNGTDRTWVIYNGQNVRIRAVTDDDFSNPSAETNITGANTTGGAIWADDEYCLIGMRTAISPVPVLIRTLDGTTYEQLTLPTFSTATTSVAIGGGYIGGVKQIVLFTDSGEAAYLEDGDWLLSDALPLGLTTIEAACCDGVFLYAIGGGGSNRAIIRSETGKTWEVVRSETGAGVNTEWNNIAARAS